MQKNLYKSQFGFEWNQYVTHKNVEVQPYINSPTKVAMVKLFLHKCLLHFLLIVFFGLKCFSVKKTKILIGKTNVLFNELVYIHVGYCIVIHDHVKLFSIGCEFTHNL